MKPTKLLYVLIWFSFLSSFGQMLPQSMVGDFTNERDNFDCVRLSVHADGISLISNHTGQVSGRLERRIVNGETLYVCEGDFPNFHSPKTMVFRFDSERYSYLIAGFGDSLEQALDNRRKDEINMGGPASHENIKRYDSRLLTPPTDSIPSDTNDIPVRLAGQYYNMAEGFGGCGLTISTNGYASVFLSVSSLVGGWKYQLIDQHPFVTVETYDLGSGNDAVLLFGFSFNRKSFRLLAVTNSVENAISQWRISEKTNIKSAALLQVTNGVPYDFEASLAKYPEWVRRERLMRKRMEQERQAEAARLQLEKPIYEKRLAEIRENPEIILTLPLQEFESPPQLKGIARNSPEVRAISDALADPTIPFKEETLIAFLDKEPWRKIHTLLARFFARNELSVSARRTMFFQIIETAKNLNMDAASQYVLHQNTPLDLVKELRDTPGIPIGVMNAVNKRLEEK